MRIDHLSKKENDAYFGVFPSTAFDDLLVVMLTKGMHEQTGLIHSACSIVDKATFESDGQAYVMAMRELHKFLGSDDFQLFADTLGPRDYDYDADVLDGLYLYAKRGATRRHLHDHEQLSFSLTASVPGERNKTLSRSIDKWGLISAVDELLKMRARYLGAALPGKFYRYQLYHVIRLRMFELRWGWQSRDDTIHTLKTRQQKTIWSERLLTTVI